MIRVLCPHCRGDLQVDSRHAGKTMKCPYCAGGFVAPGAAISHADESEESDGMPPWMIWLCIVAGHFVAFLFLAMAWSPAGAFWFMILLGLIELGVWQREALMNSAKQVQQHETTKRFLSDLGEQFRGRSRSSTQTTAQSRSPWPRRSHREAAVTAEIVHQFDDELVEIQTADIPTRRPQTISVRRQQPQRRSMWSQLDGQRLGAPLPTDDVYFYGPGTELDLGRGISRSALVYATGAAYQGTFDASLIDATLPVARPDAPVEERLPYWPSYYDCSPAQRARYLSWLLAGRQDPHVEVGYVFIYFYGLERRVIIDQADHLLIAQEVIRLLSIYSTSNSFRNYSLTFLWLCLFLASQSSQLPAAMLHTAKLATARWNEDTLGICLGIYAQNDLPLPADVAFLVAKNDPRSPSSVIVRRHGERFRQLFEKKFTSRFGNGMALKTSKKPRRFQYRPASGSLLHNDRLESRLPQMPDVLKISSQFKPIVQIWQECIDELKDYNRVHRSSGGELTTEAYEALPAELRGDEHPEFDAWMQLWQQYADKDGWPLVPVSALATLKGVAERKRLTNGQCERILTTADALGIGVVPDARIEKRKYRWNERVSFFFLESDTAEDLSAYNAAAVLLRLGVTIAEADGTIDKEELDHITRHLEGQFNLSENESKRLEQLKYLLLHCDQADNTIGPFLSKRLRHDHRLLVGKFLVGIAAADEVISPDEITALKKAYRSLNLNESELDDLLDQHAAVEPAGTAAEHRQEFHLDMQAVSRIMTETREVANILREAMAVDEEERSDIAVAMAVRPTDTAVAEAPRSLSEDNSQPPAGGLATRFQPFLQAVLARDEWEVAEFRSLARKHEIMLSGAIEAINEWSSDEFGDWLIEEGEIYTIRRDLLKESM